MGPTRGPPGSCWPQMSPILAPWTLLSGEFKSYFCFLSVLLLYCVIYHVILDHIRWDTCYAINSITGSKYSCLFMGFTKCILITIIFRLLPGPWLHISRCYLTSMGNPIIEIRLHKIGLSSQWDFLYWWDGIFILNQSPEHSGISFFE